MSCTPSRSLQTLTQSQCIFIFDAAVERARPEWPWWKVRALEPDCFHSHLALTFISWVTGNEPCTFSCLDFLNRTVEIIGRNWWGCYENGSTQKALAIIIKCSQLVPKLGVEKQQQESATMAGMLRVEAVEVVVAMRASEHKHTSKG